MLYDKKSLKTGLKNRIEQSVARSRCQLRVDLQKIYMTHLVMYAYKMRKAEPFSCTQELFFGITGFGFFGALEGFDQDDLVDPGYEFERVVDDPAPP